MEEKGVLPIIKLLTIVVGIADTSMRHSISISDPVTDNITRLRIKEGRKDTKYHIIKAQAQSLREIRPSVDKTLFVFFLGFLSVIH